jgi:hypothetical protein
MMVDSVSIRAISRMTNRSVNTIVKVLADAVNSCVEYQDPTLRNLNCPRTQADEIWSFVYSKEKKVPEDKRGGFGYGDVWKWTPIDADTKLIGPWHLGRRDAQAAYCLSLIWQARLATAFS